MRWCIKIYLKEIEWKCVDWIHVAQLRTSVRFLWTRQWTSGFQKLLASLEELCSVEMNAMLYEAGWVQHVPWEAEPIHLIEPVHRTEIINLQLFAQKMGLPTSRTFLETVKTDNPVVIKFGLIQYSIRSNTCTYEVINCAMLFGTCFRGFNKEWSTNCVPENSVCSTRGIHRLFWDHNRTSKLSV
jgi:hypothetical protein